jgi:hypothetical protein
MLSGCVDHQVHFMGIRLPMINVGAMKKKVSTGLLINLKQLLKVNSRNHIASGWGSRN